jgi:hypothetical protein
MQRANGKIGGRDHQPTNDHKSSSPPRPLPSDNYLTCATTTLANKLHVSSALDSIRQLPTHKSSTTSILFYCIRTEGVLYRSAHSGPGGHSSSTACLIPFDTILRQKRKSGVSPVSVPTVVAQTDETGVDIQTSSS